MYFNVASCPLYSIHFGSKRSSDGSGCPIRDDETDEPMPPP